MSKVRFGIVVFPGSNCDHDAHYVTGTVMNQESRLIWHKESALGPVDVVILPGGFSYGDYLRCGAIARFSPIMSDVVRFARSGGTVIGICNGFQILTESGLLPGVLLRNQSLRFVCKDVRVRVENDKTRFSGATPAGDILRVPVAHGEGNYFADAETIRRLEGEGRVVFRYCDREGNTTAESNPNGSLNNIAGIINEEGNVLGLMPHPERAAEPILGRTDGRKFFESVIHYHLSREANYAGLVAAERS